MKNHNSMQKGFVNRRAFLKTVGILAFALALGTQCFIAYGFAADIYPAEKITCIVPNSPGGGYDIIARGVAPYLAKHLKKGAGVKGGDVIIKNEPSASGVKALNMLSNAKPDGYVIGTLDSAFATETLTSKLDFDLNKFTYLLQFNNTTRIIVVRKDGFANWDDMMRTGKARELKWGVGQFGRATHVDSLIIREIFGIPAKLIPFGGTSVSMNALLRGDVQMVTTSTDSVRALLDTGEIRTLADFTAKQDIPGVVTSKSLGHPDLADKVAGHRFFIGPPNLPKPIVNTLNAAFKKALTDPEFLAWAKKIEMPVSPIYGDAADKMVKRIYHYYLVEQKALLTKYLAGN